MNYPDELIHYAELEIDQPFNLSSDIDSDNDSDDYLTDSSTEFSDQETLLSVEAQQLPEESTQYPSRPIEEVIILGVAMLFVGFSMCIQEVIEDNYKAGTRALYYMWYLCLSIVLPTMLSWVLRSPYKNHESLREHNLRKYRQTQVSVLTIILLSAYTNFFHRIASYTSVHEIDLSTFKYPIISFIFFGCLELRIYYLDTKYGKREMNYAPSPKSFAYYFPKWKYLWI